MQSFLKGQFWGDALIEEIKAFNITSSASYAAFVVVGVIADIVLIMFGCVYFALRPDLYRTGLLALVPRPGQRRVVETLNSTQIALLRWLKGQLISMAIVGALTALGLWLLGVPSSIALGAIAAFAEFIPYGPILAVIPALFVTISEGGSMLVWVLLLYLCIQQIESNLVTPIVTRELVHLPPALTVFAIVALGL